MSPEDLDLAAAIRTVLRHPLVRAELRAIFAEAAPAAEPKRVLSTADVAALRGVKPDAVLEWIAKGLLPATRAPGTKAWRVSAEDLERFVAGESRGAQPVSLDAKRQERARAIADAVHRGPGRAP